MAFHEFTGSLKTCHPERSGPCAKRTTTQSKDPYGAIAAKTPQGILTIFQDECLDAAEPTSAL